MPDDCLLQYSRANGPFGVQVCLSYLPLAFTPLAREVDLEKPPQKSNSFDVQSNFWLSLCLLTISGMIARRSPR